MSSAARDRVLKMILPAILIAGGWWGFARPTKQLEAARSELITAKSTEPKPADFVIAQNKLANARCELEEVQADHQQLATHWKELQLERSNGSVSRVANIETVTHLVDRFGLKLIGDSPAASSGPQTLPPALDEAAKRLMRDDKSAKLQFWKIEFRGRYSNVVQALGELSSECPQAIPVQLTMQGSSDDSGVRDWTLLIWL